MQLYYSFRTPVQRAADEAEVLLAGAAPRRVHERDDGGQDSMRSGGQEEL
jgi:hypothetical protein